MEKFKNIKSIPAYLPLMNVDTDKIIPKQFLKTIKRSGLGKSLFYEMRFDEKNNPIKGFILDNDPYKNSKILITGKNFGCGSSREHAPWALLDFGIKAIVSESFADIFYNNCFKNGILPVVADENIIKELAEYSSRKENIEIKLAEQEIIYGNKSYKFKLDSFKKKCLLEGLDDIALSLEKSEKIEKVKQKKNVPFNVEHFPYLSIALYLMATSVCLHLNVKHAYVLMEPKLARRMKAFGIHFTPVGEAIEFNGKRMPYRLSSHSLFENLAQPLKGFHRKIHSELNSALQAIGDVAVPTIEHTRKPLRIAHAA